jgi:hypothetical protein
MSLSRAQQSLYRPMVALAWAAHCRDNGIDPQGEFGRALHRPWYESELAAAAGVSSTRELDTKRGFEAAMAHFETLAGSGHYWLDRLHGADARRLLHTIRANVGRWAADGLAEPYLAAVARRVAGAPDGDPAPDLAELSYAQLRIVAGEITRHLRRHPGSIKAGASAGREAECPF